MCAIVFLFFVVVFYVCGVIVCLCALRVLLQRLVAHVFLCFTPFHVCLHFIACHVMSFNSVVFRFIQLKSNSLFVHMHACIVYSY